MTKEEFATYLRALQAHDYAAIKQYYTDDYRAHFDGATFDRDGVIDVERKLAEVADSSWDVLDVVADDNAIAIHAILEMRFNKDAPPDFALGLSKPATASRRASAGSTSCAATRSASSASSRSSASSSIAASAPQLLVDDVAGADEVLVGHFFGGDAVDLLVPALRLRRNSAESA